MWGDASEGASVAVDLADGAAELLRRRSAGGKRRGFELTGRRQ